MFGLRNNSWKPYVYIVFTMGRPLCHEVLPRALAKGKKLTERPTRGKNNIYMASVNYFDSNM
jgi:hypothetical protein